MTQKHTPGPWKFGFESADPRWAIVTDTRGGIVANVNSETGPDAHSAPATRKMPNEANAALIAAAPDLLAIARRIAEWEAAPDRFGGDLADVAVDARAAIAKAEGRS